jgi:hypothetical protein
LGEIATFQLDTCRTQGLKFCPVQDHGIRQSATILGGQTLTTCRHGFNNWLVWAAEADNVPPDSLSPPIVLTNAKGETLYDSSLVPQENLLRFRLLNTDPRSMFITNHLDYPSEELAWEARWYDHAEMWRAVGLVPRFDQPASRFFRDVNEGDPMYFFGFGGRIEGQQNGVSDGLHIVALQGHVLEKNHDRGSLATTNFSYHGMCGSPVMSPDGRIAGMTC